MKIGLQIPNFDWPGGPASTGARLKDIAQAADELGFASLWVMDHFFQFESLGPVDDPMLEAYATLAYLAGVTHNARLGCLVTGVANRHPGVLVKTVSTLDVLSGGRAYLGIGAGWYEREALGLGIPFGSWTERFERLEEALQIAHIMWSNELQPFNGRYYRLSEPINQPQPLSRPHPPILIGGMGEKKTLRLVARYGDACNLTAFSGTGVLRHKLAVLKEHCAATGRPYSEIEKTALGGVPYQDQAIDVAAALGEYTELARLGIEHLIVSLPDVHEIRPLEAFASQIIPAMAAVQAAAG